MKTYKEFLNEGKQDYVQNHNSFSSAIAEVGRFLQKRGYDFDEDDFFNKVTNGPKKPSAGKTNRYNVDITKNGKQVYRSFKNGKLVKNKTVAFQIYARDNGHYELNLYLT